MALAEMFGLDATGMGSQLYCAAFALGLGFWGFRVLWYRSRYDIHKIPQPPLLPFLKIVYRSLVHGEKPKMHRLFIEWVRKYGKIIRLPSQGSDMVLVCDPDAVMNEIQGWGDKDLPKSWVYELVRRLKSFQGGGLLLREHSDAKYKMVRKTVAPAFSTESLKKSFPVFLEEGQKLVDIIKNHSEKGQPFDIQDLALFLIFDAVGRFAFDVEFGSLDKGSHPLLEAIMATTEESAADFANPIRPLVKRVLPFLKMSQKARRGDDQLYEEHKKLAEVVFSRGEPDKDDHSMGACLRRLKSLEVNLTQEELLAEVATMIGGATDTTAHQLGWVVALVASHPDVQRKLVDELRAAGLYKGGREPTYQDLSELKYLSAIVKESLRLIPVAPLGSARVTPRDMVIAGYRLPKGTVVGSPACALNNVPWLWDEPDTFKPERWEKATKGANDSDESGGIKAGPEVATRTKGTSMKLFTFSYGPRDCVGQRLAVVEMQLALIILCSRYWLGLDDRMGGWEGCKEKMYEAMVVACDGGIWVHAKPHATE